MDDEQDQRNPRDDDEKKDNEFDENASPTDANEDDETFEELHLVDDEGAEHLFTLLDYTQIDDRQYLVLEDQNEEELQILRLEHDDDGEEVLEEVSQEEWNAVLEQIGAEFDEDNGEEP
ncbi:MAG: DUF1292 domain-containing protein [Firmicutes bacterium]|nr:DUF1292 domain-containing protein [Bacillota bacterium]